MLSRTSETEILRVKTSLTNSLQLLSLEALATALFTPISVASLLARVGPVLLQIERLIQACDQAVFGFLSTEAGLVGEFHDFRVSASELAAGSLLATGVLGNSAVWVRPVVGESSVQAPAGLEQMAARLRVLSDQRQPKVRVEKYPIAGGGSRYIVYIPGTQNLGARNANPFDMRSNLQLMAGAGSASSRATDMAIRRAGAGGGDRVMLVGYSQGGMVAAELGKLSKADRLDYKVDQVVTFGAPVGSNSASALPQTLSVENKADFVPHLDAIDNPKASNWVTLEGIVEKDPLANHEMESYEQMLSGFRTLGESAGDSIATRLSQIAETTGSVRYFELGQKVG